MHKPSDREVRTFVKYCPVFRNGNKSGPRCGRSGWAVYYAPRDPSITDQFEMVIHHGLLEGGGYGRRGEGRNNFCWTGLYDNADEDEWIVSKRASPKRAPDVKDLEKRYDKDGWGGRQTTL